MNYSAPCTTISKSLDASPNSGQLLQLSRPMSVLTFRTRCCRPAAAGSVPYMHFSSKQHRSVSRKCGGFTYVTVSASECKKASFASSTRSCRLIHVLVRVAALLLTYRTSSREVDVSSFLLDFTCNQSTSHFHSFAVTFVDVSSSTRDRFSSCPHHERFILPLSRRL